MKIHAKVIESETLLVATRPVATCATAVAMSVIAMTPVLTTAVEQTLTLHPDMFCSADTNHYVTAANLTPMLNHEAAYTINCSETIDIRLCGTTIASCAALYPWTCNQPLLMLCNLRDIHCFTHILCKHYCSYLPWHYKWLWFYSDLSSKPLRFSHTTAEGGGYSGYSMLRC